MANFVFNIAKGRVNELVNRVANNDPANSVLMISLWTAVGAQSLLEDLDDIAAVEAAAGTTEATTGTVTDYARIQVDDTDADIGFTIDDANNRNEADFEDQTWTALGNGNNTPIVALIVSYDNDSLAGTDANIVPMTHHDFAVTPDNSDVTAQLPTTGFFRAA